MMKNITYSTLLKINMHKLGKAYDARYTIVIEINTYSNTSA